MTIKFELGEETRIDFGKVGIDQFFIDDNGNLCQKCSANRFNIIADSYGNPWSSQRQLSRNPDDDDDADGYIVKTILPKVIKISWDA